MNNLAKALLISCLLAGGNAACAEPADDACMALRSARIHLIALMGSSDQTSLDNHNHQLRAASIQLDAVLATMMHGQNAKDADKAREFRPVWEAFKNTRETEIIPAVHAGKISAARALALGIQGERMKKMKFVMGCK